MPMKNLMILSVEGIGMVLSLVPSGASTPCGTMQLISPNVIVIFCMKAQEDGLV